ncbi:hypothetical protein F5Y04DRAFT_276407 [Hypomontagnella monticulosa]|nr:hypothetical protein F5Y04DRAFT_276407 [Hypomontagnella monticulosa]
MDQEVVLDDNSWHPSEYARLNGLSLDSQADVFVLISQVQEQSAQLVSDDPISDASLPPLDIPRLNPRVEQLGITKESMELLSQVALLGRELDQASDLSIELVKLKLEPPLLPSDPEYDCRELARSVEKRRRADIDSTSIPLEPLNEPNDESLDFPESAYHYRQEMITAIQDEKMDISRNLLKYLSDMVKDEWTPEKQHELFDEVSYRRTVRDLAITPPLSPRPQDEDHYIPNEDVCQVPILSDPSTLLDADLDRAEKNLLLQDGDLEISTPMELGPVEPLPEESPFLKIERRNIESLKAEGPLTPLNSLPPSSDLAIDLPDIAKVVDIDHVLDKQQSNAKGHEDSDIIFSDDMLAALEESAASVKRGIEQEQLETVDAIARIEIPAMDFSIPSPDWQQVPSDAASQLEWIGRTNGIFHFPSWPKNSQAERELRWSPFPSKLGHVAISESIDGTDNVRILLDSLDRLKVLTSADYVWKQPGLAILREREDEDEELEAPLVRNEGMDMDTLVRKRRIEFTNLDLGLHNSSDSASPIELVRLPESMPSPAYQIPVADQACLPNLLLDRNDARATSTLLSNYVDFHTSKRQKTSRSTFFPSPIKQAAETGVKETQKPGDETQGLGLPMVKSNLEQEQTMCAPCPKLGPAPAQMKIIKALTIERGVFTSLEKFYPNMEIIERDFDRWNSLLWHPNSISRSSAASPLAAEADIIISPATGVIVTTLLRVIQKPPPGQNALSAIRERIRHVALRYERLIILVSEGNRIDETVRDLTPPESASYTDFVGFTTGLDTNAQVYYVGGGNDTLVRWLVSFLIRHAPEAAEAQHNLIQDESLWELFLRRAGTNAYAAQAILGRLKLPDDVSEEQSSKYGLPAFIRMTPAERVEAFRGLMGGERVLGRVNETVEMRWG